MLARSLRSISARLSLSRSLLAVRGHLILVARQSDQFVVDIHNRSFELFFFVYTNKRVNGNIPGLPFKNRFLLMIIKTLVNVLEVGRVLSHICHAYRFLFLGHKNDLIFHLMFLHAHCRQQISHLLLVADLEVVRGCNNLLLLEMFPVNRVVL